MNKTDEDKIKEVEDIIEYLWKKIVSINTNDLIHRKISDLRKGHPNYITIMNLSPCFWTIINYNILNQILLDLTKIYEHKEQERKGKEIVSVFKLINKAKSYKQAFLYKGNDKCDSEKIDEAIRKSKDIYNSTKDMRTAIKKYRDKVLDHNDFAVAIKKKIIEETRGVNWNHISDLTDKAKEILNILSPALFDKEYSFEPIDYNDVESLFFYASEGYEYSKEKMKNRLYKLYKLKGDFSHDQL